MLLPAGKEQDYSSCQVNKPTTPSVFTAYQADMIQSVMLWIIGCAAGQQSRSCLCSSLPWYSEVPSTGSGLPLFAES